MSARTSRTRRPERGESWLRGLPGPPYLHVLQERALADGYVLAIPTVVRHMWLRKTTFSLAPSTDARRPTQIMPSSHLPLPQPVVERRVCSCYESKNEGIIAWHKKGLPPLLRMSQNGSIVYNTFWVEDVARRRYQVSSFCGHWDC